MRNIIRYNVLKRPTLESVGVQEAVLVSINEGVEKVEAVLGLIERSFRSKEFSAVTTDGKLHGEFNTLKQAGCSLKRLHDGKAAKAATSVKADTPAVKIPSNSVLTYEEAAAKLGISKDALRKRIKRGTIETVVSNDETFVVLD